MNFRSVANATADLVANELATIDWQQRPLAQLSLSRGAVETLSVLAKRNDSDSPILLWVEADKKGEGLVHRAFGPVDPQSQIVLDVMQSYLLRDDRYRTMVEWETIADVRFRLGLEGVFNSFHLPTKRADEWSPTGQRCNYRGTHR